MRERNMDSKEDNRKILNIIFLYVICVKHNIKHQVIYYFYEKLS